jgi:hypothetical protein|tara:strand:+ start:8414 stop:8581 length:168 start_codon:yes stop_codon:yes gene_type:complete
MGIVLASLVKTLLTKLFAEKVLLAVLLHIAEYLAARSGNDIDDRIVSEIKKALKD